MIAEAASEVRETVEIMCGVADQRGLGTFIWEPTANNNGQALFDPDGSVLPEKMAVYDEIAEEND